MTALVGIAPNLTAILAAQMPLQFVDRCRLWSADDIECDSLVRVTAETANLKVAVAGIQGFAESVGRLRRTLEREHTFVPGFHGQAIGLLALQTLTLEARLAEEAKRLRDEAKMLPPSAERDEMIRKAGSPKQRPT
jgi:hypothetical protein